MNKRRRKLLDYDNAKHAHESLYSAKKPDHNKISKVSPLKLNPQYYLSLLPANNRLVGLG